MLALSALGYRGSDLLGSLISPAARCTDSSPASRR
jgi:hypothetical protein